MGKSFVPHPRRTANISSLAPREWQVIVLEIETGEVIKRLKIGKAPIAVKISPDGQAAYVSNAEDAHVSHIEWAAGHPLKIKSSFQFKPNVGQTLTFYLP